MVGLSRSQQDIQKAARDFARGEFDKDLALELDDRCTFPEKIWRKAADLGFLGLHFPDQYGGGGLGFLEACLVAETFCRQDATMGCALALSGFGAECLSRFGSQALKEKYLPAVFEGRMCATGAFYETDLDATFTALQTTAAPDGDHWVITGTKSYVLNADRAGFFIVLCRTGADQLGMLLVDSGCDGLCIQPLGRKLGANMIPLAQLRLSNVRVPADHLVGRADQGLFQLDRFMDDVRILVAAQAVGIAAGALDRALTYVKEREAFGRKLAGFEITRHKIADMTARVETARLVVYQAARQHDAGGEGILPAIAKMVATKAAVEVADEALQLFGGYGYMKESEVERFYRDAKTLELMLGGGRALKKKIADMVIGRIK